ncbi:MAG: D-alanyl-lipoteichoic acid biosynthesis protein DltD [Desulfitobacterium hafniense]|nr:D-alanyl-lipoteichoic acid biosynthesis protein DltD [Desulfitobacterium hafniense]
MILGRLVSVAIALSLFCLSIIYSGPLSYKIVDRFWLKPGVTEAIASSQAPLAFQGTILQRKVFTTPGFLPVYGSSEISSMSEYHPSNLFGMKQTGFIPFMIGRGGYQDLVHVLSLGAQGEVLKDKKLAVILSAQWFTPEGIGKDYFAMNFSPLQAYKLLSNPMLSNETKQEFAERVMEFPAVLNDYPGLRQTLIKYAKPDDPQSVKERAYLTIGRLELSSLELKDALKTLLFTYKLSPEGVQKLANLKSDESKPLPKWEELQKQATKRGQENTTNNNLGVENSYYLQYLQPTLAKKRNSDLNATYNPSPEYKDLELLLKVIKEQGAEALFIVVPVNGRWYDYTGFPLKERQGYYQKVDKIIKDSGFKVANFGQHEHELYFLQDVMHLGWKGWVYVDEALDNFYNDRV